VASVWVQGSREIHEKGSVRRIKFNGSPPKKIEGPGVLGRPGRGGVSKITCNSGQYMSNCWDLTTPPNDQGGGVKMGTQGGARKMSLQRKRGAGHALMTKEQRKKHGGPGASGNGMT